jgi:hypothetical protein
LALAAMTWHILFADRNEKIFCRDAKTTLKNHTLNISAAQLKKDKLFFLLNYINNQH